MVADGSSALPLRQPQTNAAIVSLVAVHEGVHHLEVSLGVLETGPVGTFANIAIIAAGLVTPVTASAWPDLVIGLGIFCAKPRCVTTGLWGRAR
jgi:hypothetical protein